MLKSLIHVDLPSAETDRRMNPVEWAQSLLGGEIDLRSGEEELTVSALSVTESVIAGFEKAGVDNVIAFLVDKAVVYKDVNEEADDLHLISEAAHTTGVLQKPFDEMHMVLTHTEGRIHFIFDVRVLSRVMLGAEEMTVAVSGRPEDLRVRTGESAEGYAERVQGIAAEERSVETWRLAFQAKTEQVSNALEQTLTGSQVRVEDARIEVIRPTRREVGRFRALKFGEEVEPPTYRAVPTHQRSGAYADPFYYYYYDPYYDYVHYLLLDSAHHHDHWHTDHVAVVSPDGSTLYTGEEAAAHAGEAWDVAPDDVGFGADGNLSIADDIPDSAPPGSEAAEDWGGSGIKADAGVGESSGGGFFSDFFGGGDGGSSFSSCGSSCGGGCGGGCGG